MTRDEIFSASFRIIFGFSAGVLTIAFLGNGQEFWGLVGLLVCFSIFVRGASEAIVLLAAYLVPIPVVLLLFWAPFSLGEEVGFIDWLREHWYLPSFYVALAIYSFLRHFAARDSTWKILSETYKAAPRSAEELDHFPRAIGVLKIEEDFIPVSTYQIPSGILVVGSFDHPLLFCWNRIARVSRNTGDPSRLVLHLRKKMGPPLEVEVPWSTEFRTESRVKSGGAGT